MDSHPPLTITLSIDPLSAGLLETLAGFQDITVSQFVTRLVRTELDRIVGGILLDDRPPERHTLRVLPGSAGGHTGA